jgi:hypothetical protein
MLDMRPLFLHGQNKHYAAYWRLTGETLEWYIEGKLFTINGEGDLCTQALTLLPVLSRFVFHDSLTLRSCMTCKNFEMSGMAREMTRGQCGRCAIRQSKVDICYYCDDFQNKEIVATK